MAKVKDGWVESTSSFSAEARTLWLFFVVQDINAKGRVNSDPHNRRLTSSRKSRCMGSVRTNHNGEVVATYYLDGVATHVELATNDVDEAKKTIEVLVRMQ